MESIPTPLIIAWAVGTVLMVGYLDQRVEWRKLTRVAQAGMLTVVTAMSLLFPLTLCWLWWLKHRR